MSERQKKKHKETLKKRLTDIYAGACHGEVPNEEENWMDIESLPRLIAGIKAVGIVPESMGYLLKINCADYYVTVESATDHLFDAYLKTLES